MAENAGKVILDLGCGFRKVEGAIAVDAFEICKPDVLWDLNKYPWPFDDGSADMIYARHIMEHLDDWWRAFEECARVLKVGGVLELWVPHHTTTITLAYRDHKHVIAQESFHMTLGAPKRGMNAWAHEQPTVPLKMVYYAQIPGPGWDKWWIPRRLLLFMMEHMVNFGHENRFTFIKFNPDRED